MSNLCQYGTGCFGCCGHEYGTEKEVMESIKKNTYEFEKYPDKKSFRDRQPRESLRKGACFNLGIFEDGRVGCLIHPGRRNGHDLREDTCNTKYECDSLKAFKQWDEKKKKAFLEFIENKKLTQYQHSIGIDNDSLLKEFLAVQNK